MASLGKYAILTTVVLGMNLVQLSGSGRVLEETSIVPETITSTSSLGDTVRVDPLDHLKKYRGGYNITNKHYWSSTIFTGIYGFAVAVLWLLCGLVYGSFILLRTTFCKNSRKLEKGSCYNDCCLRYLILAVLFTLLAITACGLALGGNKKFDSRARKVVNVVTDKATQATNALYNISGAFKDIDSSLIEVGQSSKARDFLNTTSQELDTRASDLQTQTSKLRHFICKGLQKVYATITATVSLSLVFVIALLVFGGLRFRRTTHLLIVLCWIFTVLSWLFFGVYFFLQNLTGDTCTALEGFQQDPYDNSLSSILPCDELLSAKPVLTNVGKGIHESVNKMNQNISMSYGNILEICNPFSPPPLYEYQPWNCPPSSTRIGDIPRVLRMLACPDSDVTACNGGIVISASYFYTVEAYSTSIQKLLDVYPAMESLVECRMIKDALSEILDEHCKPLKKYLHMTWASFVLLSVVLVALLLIWIIGVKHQKNYHSVGTGSVKPQYADKPEFGSAT